MAFEIVITGVAQDDIAEAVDFIAADSYDAAKRWYEGLRARIAELAEMPNRHVVLDGLGSAESTFRAFPYHSHLVIYRVNDDSKFVYIARVYHSARSPLEKICPDE